MRILPSLRFSCQSHSSTAACALHQKTVQGKLDSFFREMEQMGLSPEETKKLVEEWSDG